MTLQSHCEYLVSAKLENITTACKMIDLSSTVCGFALCGIPVFFGLARPCLNHMLVTLHASGHQIKEVVWGTWLVCNIFLQEQGWLQSRSFKK